MPSSLDERNSISENIKLTNMLDSDIMYVTIIDRFVGNEEEMLYRLAHVGPLIVAVDATTWNHYLGGIIQYHCGIRLNHAVQIVGYDLTGRLSTSMCYVCIYVKYRYVLYVHVYVLSMCYMC